MLSSSKSSKLVLQSMSFLNQMVNPIAAT
jgi:hypothetical protein